MCECHVWRGGWQVLFTVVRLRGSYFGSAGDLITVISGDPLSTSSMSTPMVSMQHPRCSLRLAGALHRWASAGEHQQSKTREDFLWQQLTMSVEGLLLSSIGQQQLQVDGLVKWTKFHSCNGNLVYNREFISASLLIASRSDNILSMINKRLLQCPSKLLAHK